MRKLGLEFLDAFGLLPTALARIAAERDCRFVSARPASIDSNPEGIRAWSLRDDPQLRSELRRGLPEVPLRSLQEQGRAGRERMRRRVEGARVVLAQAG